MKAYKKDIERFRNQFDPDLHAIGFNIIFYMPNFLNGDGQLNHQSKDLSNVEKPILDIVTGRKYFERGETTLNIDDKFVINLTSKKRYAEDYSIHITFTILDKNIA